MKILQISTYDVRGGAARAAYRLHRGLREMGHDCRMAVRCKDATDDSVVCIGPKPGSQEDERAFFLDVVIQGHYIDSHRTDVSSTLFSLPYPGYDLSGLSVVREADIINLHWVAQYQSPVTLRRLFSLGKPVVWTLHDQWPFTGGCHYAAGCEKYRRDCDGCPQLSDDPFGLPAAVLRDKEVFFKDAGLTIVTPSRWMGGCARESRLFRDVRVEVIPNSVEVDVFVPIPKGEAKERLGVSSETFTLLFGAEYANEKRKGFRHLLRVITYCLEKDDVRGLVNNGKIKLICFGYASDELSGLGIPVQSLGYLDSNEKLAMAYCAANLFILPSLEDNLPNTLLEAMSCGTPVVGFDVGGVPDVVESGVTGQLVPIGGIQEMGNAILSLILGNETREAMERNCRKRAEERFSLHFQAENYLNLYRELIQNSIRRGRSRSVPKASNWRRLSDPAGEESLVPILDVSVGPNVGGAYDGVVLKALAEMTPILYKELKASNADREARLDGLRQYEQVIKWHEKKLEEVQEELKASNADREARLDGLRQYEQVIKWHEKKLEEVQEELKASNADREARLEGLRQYEERFQWYEKKLEAVQKELKASHADGDVRLKIIHLYQMQLEEAQGELRASFVDRDAILKIIGSSRGHIQELHEQISSDTVRFLRKQRLKEVAEPAPSINSPEVEAFVVARGMSGYMDDEALVLFYQMGKELCHVLCILPSLCNDQAVYMLSMGGARVTLIAGDQPVSDELVTLGITIVRNDLVAWMAKAGEGCLAGFDGVVLDLAAFSHDLLLLKGRLHEKNRIFITAGWPSSNSAVTSLGGGGSTVHGIRMVDTPPVEWLNPASKVELFSTQTEWPWNDRTFQFPPTLPSGRPWPKISVVTVTFNQGDYLEETLRSVLFQGYPNLEYIVVDGVSTDGTPAILKRYKDRLTHCISEEDEGQADALNKGFYLATGDIIAWLNSDDLYLPNTLMRVALAFDMYETDMVAGGCALVQGRSRTPFRVHHNALPFDQPIHLPLDRLLNIDGCWQKGDFFYQPEVFWSRDIWVRSGLRVDEGLFYSMDYELWVRMARAGAKIVHVPDVLSIFRMHDSQKTSGEDLPFLGELRRVSTEFMRGLR